MSAVLAVSSYPYRTSPVLRGKWVLDSILGTPPPPPPPNVPALEEHQAAQAKTMRERLAQHRANPVCASCHSRIDPLGFALENYDALGQWRTEEAGKPIDNTGELPDGTKFAGPDELESGAVSEEGFVPAEPDQPHARLRAGPRPDAKGFLRRGCDPRAIGRQWLQVAVAD